MPPRRKLSDFDRARAIAWFQAGMSVRQVAQRLAVSHSVIVRLIQRFATTGLIQEQQRSGRPRVTTARQDRFIQFHALRERTSTANDIRRRLQASSNTVVSDQTVRNRLHERNMRARKPAIRPVLAERHRNARTVWCNQHLRWTRQQWAQVLFSDESRFCLQPADGRIRVWRRRGERFADGSVLERNRYGGGSIMVWGGISAHHKTPLYHVVGNLTGVRYRDEVLQPFVVPALQQIGPNAVFQDDNARPHRSAAVNAFIQQEDINRMSWPACSPDLNPIEHLWDEIGRRLRQNYPPAQNRAHLLQQLQEQWNAIPQATVRHLIHSMRQRCVECLQNNGGHTRF